MSKILITSDLHFTAKPDDEYRFGLFKWIREEIVFEHEIDDIYILGDITDSKDRHPAELVLRVVEEFRSLKRSINGDLIILQGNHDFYTHQNLGFFCFLQELEGSIKWLDESASFGGEHGPIIEFVPFIRDPAKQEEAILNAEPYSFGSHSKKYLFLHHTFNNALASNGQKMRGGMSSKHPCLEQYNRVISGDIHVPQTLGYVTYVGSPYTIRFNDAFDPRLIVLDTETDEMYDVHYPCIKRHCVEVGSAGELNTSLVRKGDQVKVKLNVPRSSILDIPDMKREVVMEMDKIGAHLFGIETIVEKAQRHDPEAETSKAQDIPSVIRRYGKKENFSQELIEVGVQLANEAYFIK